MKHILAFFFAFLIFTACSSTIPGGLGGASSPVHYGRYEIIGPSRGIAKSTFVFGIQTGKPDLRAAVNEAVNALDGDALINLQWYTTTTNWIILPITTVKIIVKGDVIKYRRSN